MPSPQFWRQLNSFLYLVYRWFVISLVAAVLATGASGQAKKRRGPRALAVLEMGVNQPAAPATKEKPLISGVVFPRLYPVAVLENGVYNDGSIYQARPMPLAVQKGVVYDVQRAGVQAGAFTVEQPSRLHGAWVGTGAWEPGLKVNSTGQPPPEAQQLDDAPPRLKRARTSDQPSAPKKTDAPWGTARWLVAISDADNYDVRPYDYSSTPEWKRRHSAEMLALAQRELASYTRCQAAHSKSCAMKLEDVELRAFDLETNNDAEIVLTARTRRMAAGREQSIYLALLGRVGWQAQVAKVFSSVTDDAHLESTGRLELVDAVDADGDGRGELLFRELSDRETGWVLYKSGPDKLVKIFDTFASAE
jgi:hypothetical protein